MKARLINITLLLGSILVTFSIAEFGLRYMLFSKSDSFASLKEPSAYTHYLLDHHENFYNENYWKLVNQFREGMNVEHPHSLLGWCGKFSRETLQHKEEGNLLGRRPVLLYGDSFAQCVDSVRCFEDVLNSDSVFSARHYLLNYGVGGYGVDQISLLFEETYKKFEDPFVVFSLLTTDLDRSMLAFRDAQKPYFKIINGELELKGVPITLSTNEYLEENPPKIKSYLFNRFRNSKLNPIKQKPGKKEEKYIEELLMLNGLILERVFTQLEESGLDYVILIFQPESHPVAYWRMKFLLELCEKHGVDYIRARDLQWMDTDFETYDPYRYIIVGDGHPTSYMNGLVSKEIKRLILDKGDHEKLEAHNHNREVWIREWKIKYYRNQILNSAKWLENVEEKARERGIPLDSMLTLDAIYLIQKEGNSP